MSIKTQMAKNRRKCHSCLGPIERLETCVRFDVFDGAHAVGVNMCMRCVHEISENGKIDFKRKELNKRMNRKKGWEKRKKRGAA